MTDPAALLKAERQLLPLTGSKHTAGDGRMSSPVFAEKREAVHIKRCLNIAPAGQKHGITDRGEL